MTTSALLFTDLVSSTATVQRLGDAPAAAVWAEHDRRARDLLALHRGREIDRSDGFFLLFDDAPSAARYALAYHDALATLGLSARAGLHVGEVALRPNRAEDIARGAKPLEVEGLAKPLAARLMALADGGQTLLSAAARSALDEAPAPGLPESAELDRHGHYRLKGIEAPVEVFELGVRGRSAFSPPPDTEKAYRVLPEAGLWRPLREVRHNLPTERDSFVGRSAELRALAQRLDGGARLLSVLGPGGTGKTRFVRRYGLAWLGEWPGGVYFCDLSEALSLDGIFFAVAAALGVPLGKGDPAVQLGHAIAGRGRCLVILDNFEQILEHAAATLGHWLDRAAQAAFVVTSRERLHLAGEELFPIEPLGLAHEAIELFEARARAQRPGFALTDSNRAAVAEVVRLLDGLPLAIELAAARVRLLSPAQLVGRLHDRFRVLAGARGAAARQATLRAAIDWSWELLVPWEQAALAQCSVFEGGFTLEAAEAVLDLSAWSVAPAAMDAVQALVDKSLLRSWVRHQPGRLDIDEPYFGMYLSIHEYAAGKLVAAGPAAHPAAQTRHGRYFAGFGTDQALEALCRHGGTWQRRALALELDNLVAACRRAVARHDAPIAVPSYRAAWEVLDLQGPFRLGATLGAEVLALQGATPALRAAVLLTRAWAFRRSGQVDAARPPLEEALQIARTGGDRLREASVLHSLGLLNLEQGHMEEARTLFDAALGIQREIGARLDEGNTLCSLGNLHTEQGRLEPARACYESSLAIHRELGNRSGEGVTLGNLAILHRDLGRMDEALACYAAALAAHREVGDRRSEGIALGNMGNVHSDQGRVDEARAHYETALAIHRELGSRIVEGLTLGNLGSEYQREGRRLEARPLLEAALAVAREVGARRHQAFALSQLGDLHRNEGRAEQAQAHYDAAIEIHRAVSDRRGEAMVHGVVGELRFGQGHWAQAAQALRQAETLLREIDNPLELAKVLCVRGRVEAAGSDRQSAQRTLAEAQALARSLGAGPGSELAREIGALQDVLR